MGLSPTSSEGAPAFNGGTITNPLAITPAAGTTAFTITHPSADASKILNLTGVHTTLTLDCDGRFNYSGDDGTDFTIVDTSGTHAAASLQEGLIASNWSTASGFDYTPDNTANNRAWWLAPGFMRFKYTAAPADSDLANSTFALWLDATPGVGNTKLMVKAKDSGGTVRTTAIVLA